MATASTAPAKTPLPLPPGPKGRFSFGNLGAISEDWLGTYVRLAKEYGDVVFMRLLHVPICVLVHPRDIEYVLVSNPGNFTKSADYRALERVLGKGLLTSEGKFWQRQRGLIQTAFRRENILSYAPVMTSAASRMLDSWTDGGMRNIHEDMMGVTLQIVAQCLYGAEVSGAAERVGKAMEVISNRFVTDAAWALFFPFDIPDVFAPSRRRMLADLNRVIADIIRARRASSPSRGDLLDALLSARDADGRPMDDVQVRDEMMTLFLAGHETTAIALSWACFLLAQHREAEAQLVAELNTVLGNRAPTAEDLPRLSYTEMVIKEAMRLYPPAWAIGRKAVAECEIGGYRVPAGTNVFLFQWITQRDARFFPDPERFDPERWRVDPVRSGKISRFAYFPFGGGPRVCVGAGFAMIEATLLLAAIQQRFHLELAAGSPVEVFPAVTLRPKNGVHVRVRRRAAAS